MHGLRSWLLPKCDIARDALGLQYDSVEMFYDLIDYYLPDASALTKDMHV